MDTIHLDIKPIVKKVTINNKEVSVPMLGLKHKMLFDENLSPSANLKKLLNFVQPNLSVAERDLLCLHILAFNGRSKDKVIVDNVTYTLDDVYISQKLKFNIGDYEFKFKSPDVETIDGSVDLMLKNCCVYVKHLDEKIKIPDFLDLPPFVINWANDITNTISIKTHNGIIAGINDVLEFFNG